MDVGMVSERALIRTSCMTAVSRANEGREVELYSGVGEPSLECPYLVLLESSGVPLLFLRGGVPLLTLTVLAASLGGGSRSGLALGVQSS